MNKRTNRRWTRPANRLKNRFPAGGGFDEDEVDWDALGRSTYGRGKHLAGVNLRGVGESMVGQVGLARERREETTALLQLRLAKRGGAGDDDDDDGAGGGKRVTKRKAPLGPLQRPDTVRAVHVEKSVDPWLRKSPGFKHLKT